MKKQKKAVRAKTSTAKYRVRNWSEYNAGLVKRGSLTLWINEDVIRAWRPEPAAKRKRGGQRRFSDSAIAALLTLRAVFHLPLRATQGFAQSILDLLAVGLAVPCYTTLSRRGENLEVELPTLADGPLHAVLDSTGLKVFGEGEWKVRQHGYSQRRTWRKLHLCVDEANGEIQLALLSDVRLDDAAAACELLPQLERPLVQVSADGSYDKRKVYETCADEQVAQIAIPPRHDAHIWQHGNCETPPLPRDENLRRIRAIGRAAWKHESGYHRRSLAETTMFRFKTTFGPILRARKFETQQTEAHIKCAALNRMLHLAKPQSERIN